MNYLPLTLVMLSNLYWPESRKKFAAGDFVTLKDSYNRLFTANLDLMKGLYRMVICLAMVLFVDAVPLPFTPGVPGFFSNTFQNFKLSSAAAVANICPSGLRQLCNTLLS